MGTEQQLLATMARPEPEVEEAVCRLVHRAPIEWQIRGNYGSSEQWTVTFHDGSSAFVKTARDREEAHALRRELTVYESVEGPFLPKCLGLQCFCQPVLVLEDLSDAICPPPWDPTRIFAVLRSLDATHAARPRKQIPSAALLRDQFCCWNRIASHREHFLSLNLCSSSWLDNALDTILAAEQRAVFEGSSLLHMDLCGENIRLKDGRALLVNWSHACVGNPDLDMAAFLPILHLEGGPPPEQILPGRTDFAAVFSGYWAEQAMNHAHWPESGRRSHPLQLAQIALRWAAMELGFDRSMGLGQLNSI